MMITPTSSPRRPQPARLWTAALLLAGTILLAVPGGVGAASIAVNVTNDELNGDADCSLREAIQAANTDTAVSGCVAGSGADTITLPIGTYRLRRVGANEDGNATGDLDVLGDVTIRGAGGFLSVVDGNGTDRVLHVRTGTVVIEDLVIQNGLVPQTATGGSCTNQLNCDVLAGGGGPGGGILTDGGTNTTLRRVIVENNQSGRGGNAGSISCPAAGAVCKTYGGEGGDGGGVYAAGTMTIESSLIDQNRNGATGAAGAIASCGAGGDCFSSTGSGGDGGGITVGNAAMALTNTTVADNESTDWAGGVYCTHGSTCTIRDCTIAYNKSAFRGGGLTGTNSNTTVVNTTISGNVASSLGGGGVSSFTGTMLLDFVTVAGNSSPAGGGGIQRALSTLTVRSSLVADNSGGGSPDCSGAITSGGYNLVENLTGCGLVVGTGDVTGVDPGLLGLADNGGSTETHALTPASAAVDAIPAGTNGCGSTVTTDQRGEFRPLDGDDSGTAACDKGAFELAGAGDCPVEPPVCESATKSSLLLKDLSPDGSKDALKWTFQGGTSDITQAQLGNPTTGTVYNLCLYYGSTLRSAIRLSDASKWSAIGTTGYKYKDSSASAGGISAVTMKAGAAGKTKLTFTGKGDNLPDPLPIPSIPPSITVVARNSSTSTCFSATYTSATSNTPTQLKAR
jgi:CSLREA domain-containing protein